MVSHLTQNELVALGGKQVRRLHDGALGQGAIRMVSALACDKTKLYEAERV